METAQGMVVRRVHSQASGCFKDQLPLAFPGSLEVPHRFKDTALCVLSQKGFTREHEFAGFL